MLESWSEWQNNPTDAALGNLLLALCAKANLIGSEAELCLNEAIDRFISRFEAEESGKQS